MGVGLLIHTVHLVFFSIRFIFSSKGESEHLGGLKGQETKLKNKVSNNI